MDPLAVIENRIEQLESKLGYEEDEEIETTLIDQIVKVDSILNNACSGRDKIIDINKQLDDLNTYLDPQYVNMVNDSKMKSNYILTYEPSIRHHAKCIQLCKDKLHVLNSDALADIPKLNKSLMEMNTKNIEIKDQSDQTEKCIQHMMETYNQLSISIMDKLVAISKTIDVIEHTK